MQTKNQILIKKIFHMILLLSMFLSAFSAKNLTVHAQEIVARSETAKDAISIVDPELEELLETKLQIHGFLDDPKVALMVLDTNIEYPYAIIGYYIADLENLPDTFSPKVALGFNDGENWSVQVKEIDKEIFNDLLESIPITILSEDSKVIFAYYPPNNVDAQATYSGHYLPWPDGVAYTVTQRPGGCGSHCNGGLGEFAWDFSMPNGAEVWASKAGTVARVQELNTVGAFSWNATWSMWCTPSNTPPNYVVINHDQGASLYLHLKQNSVPNEIYPDAKPNRADLVGEAGNVGYVCSSTNTSTSGTHLHYQVEQQSSTTYWTQSGSVDFSDWDEQGVNPTSGNSRNGGGGTGQGCDQVSYNGVRLYEHANCNRDTNGGAKSFSSATGVTDIVSDFNDITSSIYVGSGWSVKVFEKSVGEGGGSWRCMTGSMWDLNVDYYINGDVNRKINDDISSVQIYGPNNNNCGSGGGSSASWNARYFSGHDHWWDNNNFNNQMCQETINTTGLDKNYGSSAPCGNGVSDNWVAEYNATVNFPAGSYVFYAQNDDGLKIWVNGSNIMERGGSSGYYPRCPALNLNGNTPIRAILREEGGDARVKISWSTETSVCIPPGSFNKSSPSNSTTGISTSPTLIWGSSSNSAGYNYCIDTSNNNNCDTGWQNVGSLTSKSLSGLTAGTTYYWQARSNNEGGEVFANNGTWWAFTTQPSQVDGAQFISQSPYPTVTAGSTFQIFFTIKNTGTTTWQPGSYWLQNLQNPLGANVQQSITQPVVPNSNYTWTINQTAPTTPGTYRSQWMISHNGTTFGPNMFIDVTVQTSAVSAPTLNSPANNTTLNRTDSVSLSWNIVSGATQYYAEFWGGPSINVNSGWTANTSWLLGSQWGGSYQWRVKAKNSSGQESPWSETRTLIIKPGTPSNLSPTVLSSDQIALTWSKSSDGPGNIDGYRIYRNGIAVGTVPSSSTTYQNNGLSCSTSYSFSVKAYKGSIESNSSNTITPTTQACPSAVRATAADTRDGNWGLKSSFDPGNPIQWTIHVENTTAADVPVDIGYIVKDPNNVVILNHNQTINASPGTWLWGLPGTVTSPGGTYTFIGSVTYQGLKSERTTTYTVTAAAPPTSATFGDVPMSHPYWLDIEILYANGFTAGCSTSPLLFCPEETMNRGQSAVFILRGNFGPSYVPPNPPYASAFGDNWSPGPWVQKWAQGMLQEGLTAGCSASSLLFCPWEQMPRLQAAVFGMRLLNGNAYVPPAATGTVFADITDSNIWYAKWAEQAYLSGILPACGMQGGKPLFCPNQLVSRGLGAYMIVRAKNLSMP